MALNPIFENMSPVAKSVGALALNPDDEPEYPGGSEENLFVSWGISPSGSFLISRLRGDGQIPPLPDVIRTPSSGLRPAASPA